MALCRKHFCKTSKSEQKPSRTKPFFFFTAAFLLISLPLQAVENTNDLSSRLNEYKVYQTVPEGKSLLASPQFILVDDFNTGKFISRRGASWRVKSPSPGALDIILAKQDARSQHRGYSLKNLFNLLANEKASIETFLERVDVSKAEYFVFKLRLEMDGGKPFDGNIRVTLSDWKHREQMQDITRYCQPNQAGWQDMIIPMDFFRKLDLDQLTNLRFTLISKGNPLKGNLWIDEIAFFGFNDVSFESHRDNLKGFPKTAIAAERKKELLALTDDKAFLMEIAKDTWKYFENAADKNSHLAVDHIRTGDTSLAADYTSPTNIAMDLLATIGAMDLGLITPEKAKERTKAIIATLEKMRRYKGFFYNFFDTKKLGITRSYISSVDSGWLALSLVVVRQAFPGRTASAATKILNGQNFDIFMDPENNHLVVGLDIPERNFGGYHYGMLVSEARATSLYAIGKGDIKPSHWWYLYRTPPEGWKWQNQTPKGKIVSEGRLEYFQGYYEYKNQKFVPSWGGSLFEFLMPTLVLKERKLAKLGLGLNNERATEIHRDYALIEKKYPVWGISPASNADGRKWKYEEYGIKKLSVKGYPDRSVVTPHVSFLALDTLPEDAIANLRKMLQLFEIYGEYGFYDSLDLRTGRVNTQYLALDQGMSFVAICNYLKDGSIQDRFHQDPVGKRAEKLIMRESFFDA